MLGETLLLVNPRKRHKRHSRAVTLGGFGAGLVPRLSTVQPMVLGAFQGAAGAITVNAILRFLPLPAMLTTGRVMYLTRAAVAIALGMVASKVAGGKIGVKMAEGALIVVAVDVIRDLLMSTAGINLGYYSPARVVGSRMAGIGNGGLMRGVGRTGKYLSAVSGTGKYLSGFGGAGSRSAIENGYGTANGYGMVN